MADIKKYKINRVIDAQGNLEVVHPETDAEQVLYENTIGSNTVENVSEALAALKALAENSGVTGVKGDKESTYRKGNVNITPANIGAVASNSDITAGTFTKVTVDKKGLVTGGSNATLDDIADGTTRKLENYILKTQMGVASGVATLDANGKVLSTQLPSYVDDIIEGYYYDSKFYEEAAHTNLITGEAGKIYVDLASNKTYRWSGSAFVVISETLATGEIAGTAYEGDKGAENRSRIEDLEADVNGIKVGGITVVEATNAAKLGGQAASDYALKGDVSEFDDLFVVEGEQVTVGTASVTLEKTYAEIVAAIDNKKIPILHLHDPDYDTDYAYQYVSYQTDDIEVLYFICIDGTTYRSVSIFEDGRTLYSSNTLIDDVNDTGTGAIVSKIEKSGRAVKVTRRALQNSDLPTQSGLAAGVYSAVNVSTKGVVTAGGTSIEWGTSGQTEPSDSLMVGGLFFQLVE